MMMVVFWSNELKELLFVWWSEIDQRFSHEGFTDK